MNKKIVGVLAIASVLTVAAVGMAMAEAGKNETAVNTINDLPASNPGPGETIGAYPPSTGEEEQSEDRFIDENPVKKWGKIESVDEENGRITFLSNEAYEETKEDGSVTVTDSVQTIILNMADGVPVLDAVSGMPVALSDIDKNADAYVWTSMAMTMSLPPQTAAQVLIVNVPADYAVPQYVVVKEVTKDEAGNVTIVDQDGNKWSANPDTTTVTPYLTRNMLYLDDVQVNTKCVIWQKQSDAHTDDIKDNEAQTMLAGKIMVFPW